MPRPSDRKEGSRRGCALNDKILLCEWPTLQDLQNLTTEERQHLELFFWRRVEKSESCWIWKGSILKSGGYGLIKTTYRMRPLVIRAHRFSYLLFNGPIPIGLVLDHLCRNTRCVRPDHLEAVSAIENVMRGQSPWAKEARQTHCKRGHPLMGDNLYSDSDGSRGCRACRKDQKSAWDAKHPRRIAQ